MCIQWTRVIYKYYLFITQHSNPPILQFSRTCNELKGVWSMFPCKLHWKHCFTSMLPASKLSRQWTNKEYFCLL